MYGVRANKHHVYKCMLWVSASCHGTWTAQSAGRTHMHVEKLDDTDAQDDSAKAGADGVDGCQTVSVYHSGHLPASDSRGLASGSHDVCQCSEPCLD